MVTYNGELLIRQRIDPGAKLHDFPLMVVDAARADNTRRILRSYPDHGFGVICDDTNLGLVSRRNRTSTVGQRIRFGTGEYRLRQVGMPATQRAPAKER
jgi:hypothetical protein